MMHPMGIELTCIGLRDKLVKHNTTHGALT